MYEVRAQNSIQASVPIGAAYAQLHILNIELSRSQTMRASSASREVNERSGKKEREIFFASHICSTFECNKRVGLTKEARLCVMREIKSTRKNRCVMKKRRQRGLFFLLFHLSFFVGKS